MKFALSLLLGLTAGVLAQEPPVPAPPAPVPATPGEDATAPPSVPEPVPAVTEVQPGETPAITPIKGRRVDPNQIIVTANDSINEANILALKAAQLYEDFSGKRVIMTNNVAQSEVSFTMRGPLTNKEAARFLQLTLLAEGLAMIPIPEEPDIVRLVPSGPITSPNQVPKDFYDDEFKLPVDDQLVMFQMVFKYLKPEEALKVLQSSLGQLSASGTIAAVPNASSLIITENASLIRQMIKIKKAIDVPTSVSEKWVEVVYGDVDEIAERMNEIYNDQGSSRQTTRTTRATPTPPTPAAAGASTASPSPKRRLTPRLEFRRRGAWPSFAVRCATGTKAPACACCPKPPPSRRLNPSQVERFSWKPTSGSCPGSQDSFWTHAPPRAMAVSTSMRPHRWDGRPSCDGS